MWNGIYDVIELAPETINKLRIPPAVHGYLLIVLLVSVVPRRWVKHFVLYTGLLFIWWFMGAPFAIGVVGSSLVVYAMTPLLVRRAHRTGQPVPPTALGWSIIHLMYLPCFFLTLPHIKGMQLGELTLFCGVGFMVLKASQYVWDSCRGRLGPVRWDQFLLFMTFLPTFRLGPVDRCGHFLDELDTCKSRISRRNVMSGLYRVAIGTAKMLVVVHLIERRFFPDPHNIPFGQHFFDNAAGETVGTVWLQAYAFFLRLYLIFSGYSDGAIGMCLIMGIRVPENFRWPVLSTNPADFWRRWHISMSTWLRDYVYIPLGGGWRHAALNVFVVFVYCGLWHFPVSWGPLLFGVVQTVALGGTRRWQAYVASGCGQPTPFYALLRAVGLVGGLPGRLLGWAVTFHVMVFTVLFMLDHRHSGLLVVGRMFGLLGG